MTEQELLDRIQELKSLMSNTTIAIEKYQCYLEDAARKLDNYKTALQVLRDIQSEKAEDIHYKD